MKKLWLLTLVVGGFSCIASAQNAIHTGSAGGGPIAVGTTSTPLTGVGGTYRLTNPYFQYSGGTLTSTPNSNTVGINYSGGDACGSPQNTLAPGQIDDWVTTPSGITPTACSPSGATYLLVTR